jgi:hypothetical protein
VGKQAGARGTRRAGDEGVVAGLIKVFIVQMSADQATGISKRVLASMGWYRVQDVGPPVSHVLRAWKWPNIINPVVLTITHSLTSEGTYVQIEGYAQGAHFAEDWRINRQLNQFRERFGKLNALEVPSGYRPTGPPDESENSGADMTKELERLATLFQTGMLTEEEFTAAKSALLHRSGT